jgi:NAD(P)-dependent dehydrogenase (short-subunit alcohol dehydrogenase family)
MSKHVLITGSTGNLGSVVTEKMVAAGHSVTAIYEPNKTAGNVAGANYFPLNLLDDHDVTRFVDHLADRNEKINIAILLVGGFAMGNIASTTNVDLLAMYKLNFLTAFNVAKPLFNLMQKNGGGRIILTGAKPAIEGGGSEMMAYTLSKSLIFQFAKLLNEAGEKHNIVTSVIVPSIIDTPANREAMKDADYSKWVTPEAIAANILHLISDEGTVLRQPVIKLYNHA